MHRQTLFHLKLQYYLLGIDKLIIFASATVSRVSYASLMHASVRVTASLVRTAHCMLRSLFSAQMLFVLECLYMDFVTKVT